MTGQASTSVVKFSHRFRFSGRTTTESRTVYLYPHRCQECCDSVGYVRNMKKSGFAWDIWRLEKLRLYLWWNVLP